MTVASGRFTTFFASFSTIELLNRLSWLFDVVGQGKGSSASTFGGAKKEILRYEPCEQVSSSFFVLTNLNRVYLIQMFIKYRSHFTTLTY